MNSQPQNSSAPPPEQRRVEKIHGGVNVEEIVTPELMNEPECEHKNMVRDASETEFIAFVCDNPRCGIVKLFNKE